MVYFLCKIKGLALAKMDLCGMGCFREMAVWYLASVTIKLSSGRTCSNTIHVSDRGFPLTLQWPLFSCTTLSVSVYLGNVCSSQSQKHMNTDSGVVIHLPSPVIDCLHSCETPSSSVFLQGLQDTLARDISDIRAHCRQICQMLGLLKPNKIIFYAAWILFEVHALIFKGDFRPKYLWNF